MNPSAWKAIKIARTISKSDPLLGYELEKNVRAAVINPGSEGHDKKFDRAITVLKSLRQELESAMDKMDGDLDAKEFASWFDNAAEAEEEELRRLLKDIRTSSSRTAGPKDWLKKMFKGKPEEQSEPSVQPSYRMDDSAQDDFVEGKRDWKEPGQYIEQETNSGQHGDEKRFLDDVDSLLKEIDIVKKKPSKSLVEKSLHFIKELITKGEDLVKSVSANPKVDLSEKPEAPAAPGAKKPAMSPADLDSTVSHYVDMLQSSLGDEKKLAKFLREFFHAVSPVVGEERGSLASGVAYPTGELIRAAHALPALRRVLMPVIASRLAR